MLIVSLVKPKLPADKVLNLLLAETAALRTEFALATQSKLDFAGQSMQWTFRADPTAKDTKKNAAVQILDFLRKLDCDAFSVTEKLPDRSKRMLFQFDADMTFYQHELIDELGQAAGRFAEISEITRQAMEGHASFTESLQKRVALLEGLDAAELDKLANRLQMSPGIEKTMRFIASRSDCSGIVSGGFLNVIGRLKSLFSLDYVEANTLEVSDDKLTGKTLGRIVDAAAKAEILLEKQTALAVPLGNTVAWGDGANDLAALETADFGIAYRAKEALRNRARAVINSPDISLGLYLLGFREEEIEARVSSKKTEEG